jgi:hypothetical protein
MQEERVILTADSLGTRLIHGRGGEPGVGVEINTTYTM